RPYSGCIVAAHSPVREQLHGKTEPARLPWQLPWRLWHQDQLTEPARGSCVLDPAVTASFAFHCASWEPTWLRRACDTSLFSSMGVPASSQVSRQGLSMSLAKLLGSIATLEMADAGVREPIRLFTPRARQQPPPRCPHDPRVRPVPRPKITPNG